MSADSNTSENIQKRNFTVFNKMGIHARPAAMIVRVTNKYPDTEAWVTKDGESINGKSIMGLMMLAAGQNTQLEFSADGPHAEQLLDDLEQVFNSKFEEA